jgi:hypothetical protein
MGERRNANKMCVRKPKGKILDESVAADGRIILEWISEK